MAETDEYSAKLRLRSKWNRATSFVAASLSTIASIMPGRNYVAVAPQVEDHVPKEPGTPNETAEIELICNGEGLSPLDGLDSSEEKDEAWVRDIWAVPNRAIVASYFSVGFALKFLFAPLSYYMVHELDIPPAQQNVVWTLSTLPWCFKVAYGFMSDMFPIRGKKRKPYFAMGWAVYVIANLMIALSEQPKVQLLAASSFIASMAYVLADVTADAVLVERSKLEASDTHGSMQATGYIIQYVGRVFGSILGMLVYNKDIWGWGLTIQQCFMVNGLVPLMMIGPWLYHLRETPCSAEGFSSVRQRLYEQCLDVFRSLELKAVHLPMAVLSIYYTFQIQNAAWRSFLVDGLGFEAYELGILGIVAAAMSIAGLLAYKRWFFHSSWRGLFIWTTLLSTCFSSLQLVLIFRINMMIGIDDLIFSIGDDSVTDFVLMITFLPAVQMLISMCPDGSEGTMYAILTTMWNMSVQLAACVATSMTKIWDVSNETLQAGNFGGMWRLTLLTILVRPVPLLLIRGISASQEEQRALQESGIRSRVGALSLLGVLSAGLVWTAIQAIQELS